MFTRNQWFEFFRTYGLDAEDAQAAAEQAYQDQLTDPDMPSPPPLSAQPKQGHDPYINGARPMFPR